MSIKCRCGHKMEDHRYWGPTFNSSRCEPCAAPWIRMGDEKEARKRIQESWHNFKQDNLSYILEKYESSDK